MMQAGHKTVYDDVKERSELFLGLNIAITIIIMIVIVMVIGILICFFIQTE
jgi:hypothetical protein